jgi:hypothetical protein
VLGLSFGNLPPLSRRGPTSFERRFLEEFEELFLVLAKTAFCSFEFFRPFNKSPRLSVSPNLE